MTSTRHFAAPWSVRLRWSSLLVGVVLLALPEVMFVEPKPPWWVALLMACVLAAVVGGAVLGAVRGYEIRDGALCIQRLLWDTRLALSGLQSAALAPHAARGAVKVAGSSGFLGYMGLFWSRNLGRFHLGANNLERTVVLRFRDGTWVVSPDRPEEFIQRLNDEACLKP